MKYLITMIAIFGFILLTANPIQSQVSKGNTQWEREPGFEYPKITKPYVPKPFKPRQYVIYRTIDKIHIDGKLNESSWQNAKWTENHVHIVFEPYKNPNLNSRSKILWDDENIYFAGYLEEPNIYAHMIKNDTIICHDSDYEIFLDVDGDARNYIELEFNAIGTVWDILHLKELDKGAIPKGFRNYYPTSEPWDIKGLKLAVRTDGTVNYPLDKDEGWYYECSIPWSTLQELNLNDKKLNQNGTTMRLNFSRVQFNIKEEWPIMDWSNVKNVDWLWSPELTYRAHVVETFGRVVLSDKTVINTKDYKLENAFPFIAPPQPPKDTDIGSMVKIKGGTYTVGPDDEDPSGASPKGEVTVDDFYIDRYEVTIGEYAKFLNANGHDEFYWEDMASPDWCGIIKEGNGNYTIVPGKELYPVCLVKLEGAKAYAKWIDKRLPTEYEWEIAARGSKARLYPWGNESPDVTRANYDYHVGHTVPVGSYEKGKTPEGVYDMAGNVNEMIDQKWKEYPWGKKNQDPKRTYTYSLCRGGAWTSIPSFLKATYRDVVKSHYMSPFVGFRCAKDAR